MKNTNQKNSSPFAKAKLILAAIGLIFTTENAMCQQNTPVRNENMGFSTSAMVSASGYGGRYVPMLYFKRNRQTYFIGPVIQNQKLNFAGFQFNYDYALVGEDAPTKADNKNVELFCFFTSSYDFRALLGKRALWEEHMANSKYEGDPCKLRFKSVSMYGGIGLKIRILKNLKWINSIGAGGYTSFDFPGNLYYNASNLGLIIKTGISFDFKK